MPRKKKNEQSPNRVPGGPLPGDNFNRRQLQVDNVALMSSLSPRNRDSDRQKITQNMREIFSHLDPEVIHMVLSEVDFKVENAMDSLLELSIAAELAAPVPSPMSGFESTAAALLHPQHDFQPAQDPSSLSEQLSSPLSTSVLTEDLDVQLDQELQNLSAQQGDLTDNQYSSDRMTLPFLPPKDFPDQVFPELQGPECRRDSAGQPCLERALWPSGAPSPFDQHKTLEGGSGKDEKLLMDLKNQMTEEPPYRPKPPLDLGASGRPSAFQMYKKNQPSQMLLEQTGHMPSENTAGGNGSQVNTASWNLRSLAISPRLHGKQGPCFITPIAPSHPLVVHPSPWGGQSHVNQAPLKNYATIPKSWAMAAHNPGGIAPGRASRLCLEGKVLVLLRGPPGSGKSTLARAFLQHNPCGVALSTDDYFTHQEHYNFNPTTLGEAHEWNHKRAKEAFEKGVSPIIIDNTNMQGWEMKPYVAQALKHNYKVLFRETDTWWKNKPRELERRSKHGVSVEKIRRMLDNYERFVTVKSIMGAQMPEMKQRLQLESRKIQSVTPEAKCPDLVDEPGLMDRHKHCQPNFFSSLPDVSSIGHPSEAHKLEYDDCKSADLLDFQPTSEHSNKDNDMDLGTLDSELDALNQPCGEQVIPDCIVELVINEDHHSNKLPVAFSESIKQRVPREKCARKFYCSDLEKHINQSSGLGIDPEQMIAEGVPVVGGEEAEQSKTLNFAGDWPSEGPLEQRQVRRKECYKDGDNSEVRTASKEVNSDEGKMQSGNNLTEFQKLLDLIQTGVVTCYSGSSCSSPVSLCEGQNLEKDDKIEGSLSCSSKSEEEQQNITVEKSSKVDLPDCVLDRNATDFFQDTDDILKGENETNRTSLLDIGCEKESNVAADNQPGVTSESTNPQESYGIDECDIEFVSENDTKKCNELPDNEVAVDLDCRQYNDLCQGLFGGEPLEPESCVLGECSQERKQRQGRRSGKHCKLALTFTQNCLAPSDKTHECPNTTSQIFDNGQSSITKNPDCDTSLCPTLELCSTIKEMHLQTESNLCTDRGCHTQTEPQDFGLLWRLNHQDDPATNVIASYNYSSDDVKILCGVSSRFVPEVASAVSAAVAVNPSIHNTVPYRMVHEKSTQVEDNELGAAQSRLESLSILSRHFKLVGLDTLEDLYDKCHQDLEWTTNLLLDSGERLFKDEDVLEEMLEERAVTAEQSNTVFVPALDNKLGNELPDAGLTAIGEELEQCPYEVVTEIGENSDTESLRFGLETSLIDTKSQPETNSHIVSTSHGLSTLEQHVDIEQKVIVEDSGPTPDDIASLEEVHRLLEAELEELEREQKMKADRRTLEKKGIPGVNIQSVELKLSTELALQLTELFGPVGVEPGTCSSEEYAVQMDMNLAKLLHQKWKETIQERQRQATLSYQLLLDGAGAWHEAQLGKTSSHFPSGNDSGLPIMDHWNFSQPRVSLRNIMEEERAMQENVQKSRQNRANINKRDGSSILKEEQLYSRFPSIDRLFLQDIFRDNNCCLTQTELFLNSLLDQEPVKTVVAPELPQSDHHRTPSKEREKKLPDSDVAQSQNFQDTEDPEYKDFRAEATLQRSRQIECFSKAAAAYKQGHKEVASFYAQQGHLHGQRMYEANHRAAAQIFERVNSSLLPKNILDLHGLHVNEALEHLRRILQNKTADCEQGLCRPQLSVITGRGNHSQGGVARIRPAVINYLKNTHYRYTEPKPGLVVVSLK
nr:NEDD4-binding protein 2 [Nerophis lumbriciformis]